MTIQKTSYKTKAGIITREYKYDKEYVKHYRWTTKDGRVYDCITGHPESKTLIGYRVNGQILRLSEVEE